MNVDTPYERSMDELHKFDEADKDNIIRGLIATLGQMPNPVAVDGRFGWLISKRLLRDFAGWYSNWWTNVRNPAMESAGKTWFGIMHKLDRLHLLERIAEKKLKPYNDVDLDDGETIEIFITRKDGSTERHNGEWLSVAAGTIDGL